MDTSKLTLSEWVEKEINKNRSHIDEYGPDDRISNHLRKMVEIQSALQEKEARIKAIEIEAQVRCQLIRQESDARIDSIRAETWRKF